MQCDIIDFNISPAAMSPSVETKDVRLWTWNGTYDLQYKDI